MLQLKIDDGGLVKLKVKVYGAPDFITQEFT